MIRTIAVGCGPESLLRRSQSLRHCSSKAAGISLAVSCMANDARGSCWHPLDGLGVLIPIVAKIATTGGVSNQCTVDRISVQRAEMGEFRRRCGPQLCGSRSAADHQSLALPASGLQQQGSTVAGGHFLGRKRVTIPPNASQLRVS